jgi:hypothetical protein
MKLSERMKQREATDETPSFGTVSTRAAGAAEAKGVLSATRSAQAPARRR